MTNVALASPLVKSARRREEHVAHLPVMLEEVLEFWPGRPDGLLVDQSFGMGGHTFAALQRFPEARILAFDADPQAVAEGRIRQQAEGVGEDRLRIEQGWAGSLTSDLERLGVAPGSVSGVLFDTGVRSEMFEDEERGLSFRNPDAPLNMKYDPDSEGPTAADLLASLSQEELARLLWEYGGDRQARRIAATICSRREAEYIATCGQLSELVIAAHHRSRIRSIDARTQVWQALRMAVNDEAGQLTAALDAAHYALEPHGRLVVICFESTLDRIAKSWMRAKAQKHVPFRREPVPTAPDLSRPEPEIEVLTPKALKPTEAEVRANPRARSAKLRVAEKLR